MVSPLKVIIAFIMDFWSFNWGDLASGAGLIVSLAGLLWIGIEARRARSAAQAAQIAARHTRHHITRHLQTVDLERAVGLIRHIKLLHDTNRWEGALEHYHPLRTMLSDIVARSSNDQEHMRGILDEDIIMVESMENFVRQCINSGIGDSEQEDLQDLNPILNGIESALVAMSSSAGFGDL